jgi:prophage regulatory protein
MTSSFSEHGLRRLQSIIGPSGPIPVSRSTWWAGVKSGRFPSPVKLGPRITAWRNEDIVRLVESGVNGLIDESNVAVKSLERRAPAKVA